VSPIIESRRPSRCHLGLIVVGPARLAGEAGQLRGGRFCSGAPVHRLRHRQGFIGDHRLQRSPARCSVAAMVAFRSPSAVNTSMASFSRRRSRSAGSRRRFAHTSDAASLAACLNVCLPAHTCFPLQLPHRSAFLRPHTCPRRTAFRVSGGIAAVLSRRMARAAQPTRKPVGLRTRVPS
jgi:hypothetical protein